MDDINEKKRSQNPRSNANIFEILTYSWVLNLFKKGRKKDLELDDLYIVLNEHKSISLGCELEERWKLELVNAKDVNREPSLLRVLIRMFGTKYMLYGLLQGAVEFLLRMSQPIFIGKLLVYFDPDKSNTTSLSHAYIYASCLILNILIMIFMSHYCQVEMGHCGMKMRVACCSMIYKKALRLSKTAFRNTTVGQVVNLLSNDVNRFDIALGYIHNLWIGPLQTITVSYLIWQEIGVSSLFGIAVVLIFIPFQTWMGKKTSEIRLNTAQKTDERTRLINEIISGIQVIKMYAWEKPFTRLVQCARKLEIRQIRKSSYIKFILQSITIFHTKFALFTSIFSYVLLGNYINIPKVYVTISYFSIIASTMTVFFPRAIGLISELLISIKRIQHFLLYDEKVEKPSISSTKEITISNGIEMSIKNSTNVDIEQSVNFSLNISNASAKWIHDQPENSLNNINLTVEPGQLVTIIGPVGAGKSSLLQAILRELPLSEGSITANGEVSYVSQDPWLFSGSIKQNILFGSPMDLKRYKQVIQVCALTTDLEQFPYGDKTIVGERGTLLSGGQKARINLARAIYKETDIYLLDDPLSAVDTRVGKHLFDECIKGYLKGKTCILVTHQIQYLTKVDRVILMKNANIIAEGSYHNLQSAGLDITKLIEYSEETLVESVVKSNDNNTIANGQLNKLNVLSRSSSNESVLSSINEKKATESQDEPVKVAETKSFGNVSFSVYLSYISAGGNVCKISFLFFICIFTQLLSTGGDYWINIWVTLEDYHLHKDKNNFAYNSTSNNSYHELLMSSVSRKTCIIVFSILIFSLIIVSFVRCAVLVSFFMKASTNLHNNMFNAISKATMHFFNTNPSGRILNHFTNDLGNIDDFLPIPVMSFINVTLTLIGIITVVGTTNSYLMIPTFFVGLVCYYIMVFYLTSSRSVKRIEGVSRSPIITHLNASLQGLITIRAFKAEQTLCNEFDKLQDLHSSAWYLFIMSNDAVGCLLDIICLIYISFLIFSFLVFGNDIYGGSIGLVITQAMRLTNTLQWGIRQSAELENQMTSVERVLEYTNVPQEAAAESPPDKKPPKDWPDKGQIVFQSFYLSYGPNTHYVLQNININIQPMEKVGIVGRTGAGKSSLIEALFRLAFNEGNIIIDGVEIHELGLYDLRSKISIIPQEPVLFSESMRKNLDPMNEYSDYALWDALDQVELKDFVEDLVGGLNSKVSESGSNFSVGQRQLVCMARAILRNNNILVLDEATANVDTQTDILIQNTIRNTFRTCTVLTVAHRLNTVMDSDKILMMDNGTVVEFDHPFNLLKNKDGYFYKMVEETGQATANVFHNIAAQNFKMKQST